MLDRAEAGVTARVPMPPAHRPSRRHEIVEAAIKVFARNGFAETSIQDVADEADMVPTAVYYHFAGKDELFDVALGAVLAEIDDVVERARPAGDPIEGTALSAVIAAVWEWIEARPEAARILYTHLPGATRQAQVLRQEFEKQHIQQAFVYARQGPPGERRHRNTAAAHAAAMLSVRTLIHLLITIHPLRLEGGPLSKRSPRALLRSLEEVSLRLVDVG